MRVRLLMATLLVACLCLAPSAEAGPFRRAAKGVRKAVTAPFRQFKRGYGCDRTHRARASCDSGGCNL